MGGGYSGVNFGHPKSEAFRNGGRGYSGVNFGHPKSEAFQNGGGVYSGVTLVIQNLKFSEMGGGGFLVFNSRKGLSGKFGPKLTVQPETCLCITVVSHILRMWRLIILLCASVPFLLSIEWNWTRLDGPAHAIVTKNCEQNNRGHFFVCLKLGLV